ncbi:uncharacterized protein LOC127806366 [Diospyros lotus]|uniref:uncharacterized protein LOC127806366 n=1 Tax=Diospyros lotus TaxID=55363 RepID=UPI0022573026|nr:uncharacterized protein LOC127806366 [Diospyros lotus]
MDELRDLAQIRQAAYNQCIARANTTSFLLSCLQFSGVFLRANCLPSSASPVGRGHRSAGIRRCILLRQVAKSASDRSRASSIFRTAIRRASSAIIPVHCVSRFLVCATFCNCFVVRGSVAIYSFLICSVETEQILQRQSKYSEFPPLLFTVFWSLPESKLSAEFCLFGWSWSPF